MPQAPSAPPRPPARSPGRAAGPLPGTATARTRTNPPAGRVPAGRPGPRPAPRRRPRTGSPDRRVAVLLVLALAVLVLFTGRLLQVQALDATTLARAALGSRLVPITLPAERGTITDRNGAVLARSVERRDITADPQLFGPDPQRKGAPTAAQAADLLAPVLGLDPAAVTASLTPHDAPGARRSHFAYVARGVAPAVWHQVQDLRFSGHRLAGLYSERADRRTYPAGAVAGNVVGFLGKDGTPLAGLEYADNTLLTGHDGEETYERGLDGRRIPMGESTYRAPKDGADVRLTIDQDLQYYAQQAISAQVARTGSQWGTVVAIDPRTGEVLALAESGSVDPNDPGATPAADLGNRALQDTIEPGSTGKVITAAAAIQEGLVEPDTRLTVPGILPVPRSKPIHDAEVHGQEKLTFAGVLAQSSNIGTVLVGQELTKQQRYDYLRAFGIGTKQLGMPGETAGILARPQDWDGRQQFTILFGQGYGVNVLQAAQVYATIANGGVRLQPRIVAGSTGADGVYHPSPAAPGTRVVSADTARKVISMLEGAVGEDGTGASANVPGFRVAGKTGTAQAVDARGGYADNQFTASFIGMAPAQDPRIVLAVTLQHPQTDHFGGTVAAPVFSDVMSYALQQQGIAPSGTAPDLVPLTWQ